MIRTGELARLRSVAEGALPDSGEIQRPAETSDGMGGRTQVPATIAVVDCRVDPNSGRIALSMLGQSLGERIGNREALLAALPSGTDVQPGDWLVVGAVTYEVLAVPAGSWEIIRQIVVVKL